MTAIRRWIGGAAAVVGTLALLLAFAAPRLQAPFVAAERLDFAPQAWASSSGRIVPVADGIRIETDAPPGNVVVSRDDLALPADRLRYLHYRADAVAPDARLLLLWNGDGGMQRRLLPRVAGRGTVDLAASDGWRGTIATLTLAVVPVDYLAAEAVPTQAFVLRHVELRSDNWMSAMSALLTDWLAPRPWSGTSINTTGGEFGVHGASATAFVACWIAWMLLVARASGGRARLRRAWPAVVAIGVGVLALDTGRDLLDRTRAVRSAEARIAHRAVPPLGADPALVAEAAQLRAVLGARDRVVVHGDPFQRDYTVYLLRERDVAQLLDLRGFATRATLNDAVLVVAGGDGSEFHPDAATVQLDDRPRAAIPLWRGERLAAYRLGSAGVAK
ncbi:hypothetical protein [Chiayiivirga flava]|uniref:Uncharacterized protein n=1 Tax=Chiayiivirga flava TaxID=659595 RepID=A0A7W8D5T8_9GAMM|nr:hypothetical protein [Chiayiivirga flava]MBB5207330.1 hypothetical protein [Chiayiivirga flava]